MFGWMEVIIILYVVLYSDHITTQTGFDQHVTLSVFCGFLHMQFISWCCCPSGCMQPLATRNTYWTRKQEVDCVMNR